MTKETNLIEEREELKRRIAAGEFKPSIDVILETMGRFIQRLTGLARPPAFWISALAIALLISLIGFLSALLTGGVSDDGYWTITLGGVLVLAALLTAKSAFDRAYATLSNELLDALESSAGLSGLENWLTATGAIKRPGLIGLVILVASFSYSLSLPEPVVNAIDVIVMGGITLLFSGYTLYYVSLFVTLPLRLSRCQFKLHAEDPVNTEVVAHWSGMMNHVGYMFALVEVVGILFSISLVTFTLEYLVFIVPAWLPLIALFVVNQMALSQVITQSKRKSLNEVEAQMAALRPKGDPPDRDTMETLLGLWDYHDRIKGTRNSVLDIGEIMNLVNTLLIPLLGFLVANREAIFELLGWTN